MKEISTELFVIFYVSAHDEHIEGSRQRMGFVKAPTESTYDELRNVRPTWFFNPTDIHPIDFIEPSYIHETKSAYPYEVVFARYMDTDGNPITFVRSLGERYYEYVDGPKKYKCSMDYDYFDLQRLFNREKEIVHFYINRNGFIYEVVR